MTKEREIDDEILEEKWWAMQLGAEQRRKRKAQGAVFAMLALFGIPALIAIMAGIVATGHGG